MAHDDSFVCLLTLLCSSHQICPAGLIRETARGRDVDIVCLVEGLGACLVRARVRVGGGRGEPASAEGQRIAQCPSVLSPNENPEKVIV